MPQVLSYYHNQLLETGAVVEVLLNRRKITGVVLSSSTLKSRKLDFKKSVDFELKNISKVISEIPLVSEMQIKIAQWLSSYYYSPIGPCLKHVLPQFWGKKGYQISNIKFQISNQIQNPNVKSNSQTFLMVPENTSGKYYMNIYADQNPIYISGAKKNKEYFAVWNKVASGEAKLIIGTRVGLFLPFRNLKKIIIDDDANEAYKSDMTPKYNSPDLAKYIATIYDAKIEIKSILPQFENLSPTTKYQNSATGCTALNMVSEIKAANYSIFSRDLKDLFLKFEICNLKLILFVPRRGYSNYLRCNNCGYIITCPNCTSSLVLHSESKLYCHHCGHSSVIPKHCSSCDSAQIKAHGLGIDKAKSELIKFFSNINLNKPTIYQLDSDSVKNENEEEKIVENFIGGGPAIMLATQILFSHKYVFQDLTEKPIIGIMNSDSLMNYPDFRSNENILRYLLTLSKMSSRLIIQTYNFNNSIFGRYASEHIPNIITDDLKSRKLFHYPPFGRFVKISYKHPYPDKARYEIHVAAEKMRQLLRGNKRFELSSPSSAFIAKISNLHIWNLILKDNEKDGEIKTRNQVLRVIPNGSGWSIDVDPKNII
jgi:primosomal protein N' (replication factor Y) (superfamily II helicase)